MRVAILPLLSSLPYILGNETNDAKHTLDTTHLRRVVNEILKMEPDLFILRFFIQ